MKVTFRVKKQVQVTPQLAHIHWQSASMVQDSDLSLVVITLHDYYMNQLHYSIVPKGLTLCHTGVQCLSKVYDLIILVSTVLCTMLYLAFYLSFIDLKNLLLRCLPSPNIARLVNSNL